MMDDAKLDEDVAEKYTAIMDENGLEVWTVGELTDDMLKELGIKHIAHKLKLLSAARKYKL